MLTASKVKMSGSEKNKSKLVNTSNKIFGEHIRQFLHKKWCVTRTFHVLVLQNGIEVVQNDGKQMYKKSVLHVQICFLLMMY